MYKNRIIQESLEEAKDLFEAGLLSECEYNEYIKLLTATDDTMAEYKELYKRLGKEI